MKTLYGFAFTVNSTVQCVCEYMLWVNKMKKHRCRGKKKTASTTDIYLHGVVKVANLARCLSWRWTVEAGVVDVADNALNPGQGAC